MRGKTGGGEGRGGVMVLNATFNNISAISGRSVLLMEEIGGPGEKQDFNDVLRQSRTKII